MNSTSDEKSMSLMMIVQIETYSLWLFEWINIVVGDGIILWRCQPENTINITEHATYTIIRSGSKCDP
jgi:hypothetical protein